MCEQENPKSPGNSFVNLFIMVDLPTPDGPHITSGFVGFGIFWKNDLELTILWKCCCSIRREDGFKQSEKRYDYQYKLRSMKMFKVNCSEVQTG